MNQRSTILVPEPLKASADALSVALGVSGGSPTVTAPCVPAADDPAADATHYGCSGQLTDALREELQSNIGAFPGVCWWRTGALDQIVTASSQLGDVGKSMTYDDMLASVGLKRQVKPIT